MKKLLQTRPFLVSNPSIQKESLYGPNILRARVALSAGNERIDRKDSNGVGRACAQGSRFSHNAHQRSQNIRERAK